MDLIRITILILFLIFTYFYLVRCFLLVIQPQKKRNVYILVLIFMFLLNIGFWGSRFFRWQGHLPNYFYYLEWVSYTCLGLMLFFLICFFIADLFFILNKVIYFFKRKSFLEQEIKKNKIHSQRRSFLHMISVGCASILTGIAFYNARKTPEVKKVFVPILNLHSDLKDFNIVQLTDFHIGQTIGLSYVHAVVERVNSLNPDIIVITGDLVDGFVHQIKEWVEPLSTLKAKYGIYYVTGNHEYYWDATGWIQFMQSIGCVYLGNSNQTISIGNANVVIAGLTDLAAIKFNENEKTDCIKSTENASVKSDLKILLAHQPNSAFEAAKLNFYDLQISGHTHGGQMWPMTWMIHFIQYFRPGLTLYEKMWVYVSRGTGYWGPPSRLGSDSEITHIFFKQA